MDTKRPRSKVAGLVTNLLNRDGSAQYFSSWLEAARAEQLFNYLRHQLPWEYESGKLFGRSYQLNRQVCWMSTTNKPYRYSGKDHLSISIPPVLSSLLVELETSFNWSFNSCLANFYPSGKDGMGWHADNESLLNPNAPIASLSLGASRKFSFKHNQSNNRVDCNLESGSLLLMDAKSQLHWKHSLPKQLRVNQSRINLTFRVVQNSGFLK